MKNRITAGLVAFILLATAGCKEATLEPELNGTIQGIVLDYETNAPLARSGVATTPPTSAIVSDDKGAFTFENIPEGNYTVAASRPGYLTNSVNVSVREGALTQAMIFLKKDVADTTSKARMGIDILNWSNRVRGDTTLVSVEYRVRNAGSVKIPSYEVYFRIKTADKQFYQEQKGTSLDVGQSDIGRFEKNTLNKPATEVSVDNYWFDGMPKP